MNNDRDRDKKFDDFDPNKNQNQQGDGERNNFFRARGGHTYTGQFYNYGDRQRYQNQRGGGYNNMRGGDRPNFNVRGNPHFYGGGRGGYNNNYNNGPRQRYGENNNYNNYNRNNNYTDRRPRYNPNYDREPIRDNEFFENEEENEIKKMKVKNLEEFKKNYGKIISEFKILFVNESLKEEQIIDILQNIKSNPNLTIFEAMNSIYRQVQIIKTLPLKQSNRQYGPNKDVIEFEFEKNSNKENLREVIQKYKIYENENEMPEKEKNEEDNNERNNISTKITNDNQKCENIIDKYWFYIDDFDKRRKLIKDEEGYFNYLPIMNPGGKSNNISDIDSDLFAKNENEINYHALFYKTIMCKECDLSENNKNKDKLQLLCPYAHDILKDFRIIYKYTDEEVCKFMISLQSSGLFIFQNYLNYIPMSLKPEFNFDTFKVHPCQLDEGSCPNDYHICPYYHKKAKLNDKRVDEQRRPPSLFGYLGSTGDICFNQKKSEYHVDKCPCGIFCRFVHSKNEYNYHPDHFRKEFRCTREKNKFNKCIYLRTCYGKHPKEEYKKITEEDEKEEEVNLDKIDEEDEDIKEIKKKVDNIVNVAKAVRCRKCQRVENIICYYKNCKHFICFKCNKKICKGNTKDVENNKNNEKIEKKNLLCPFCGTEITKGSLFKLEF